MRGLLGLVSLLTIAPGVAGTQQGLPPAIQEGPMAIPAAKTQASEAVHSPEQIGSASAQTPSPVADAEGFFRVGPGVVAPKLENPEPVKLPQGVEAVDTPRICFYGIGVKADGSPGKVETLRASDDAVCDEGAEKIWQWRFTPGSVDGKAVPVWVRMTLRFRPGANSAIPFVQGSGARLGSSGSGSHEKAFDTPPVATHVEEAEYSDEARRAGVEGTVLIELTVSETGMPADIRVLRPVEMGLSERAVQAVSQYRFRPALKDGKPIAATINVEVSFHLARRPRS
jgi:TonB family protein